ncbi:MAG: ribbon-helix-helix domain-containing protein [Beijerinckiaceae bacterium]
MQNDPARVVKRSLTIAGHATSISLEEPFWIALKAIAVREGVSLAALVQRIDQTRKGTNLSSALRVFVLQDAQARAVRGD